MLSFFSYQISSNVPNFFLILFSSETKYFVGLKLLHISLNDSETVKAPSCIRVYCTRINTSTQTAELTCLREAAVALKRHAAAALLDIFVLEQM